MVFKDKNCLSNPTPRDQTKTKQKIKIKQHHRVHLVCSHRGTLSNDFNFYLRAMVLILDTTTGKDSIPPKWSGGKSWVVWAEGRGVEVGQKASVVPLLLKPSAA